MKKERYPKCFFKTKKTKGALGSFINEKCKIIVVLRTTLSPYADRLGGWIFAEGKKTGDGILNA
ncbi:MAG: hypothetical protein IJS60_02445 [Abditibacteriota bacterium]|nr:hypothetical protein [Abditibacteriota bacterium]